MYNLLVSLHEAREGVLSLLALMALDPTAWLSRVAAQRAAAQISEGCSDVSALADVI